MNGTLRSLACAAILTTALLAATPAPASEALAKQAGCATCHALEKKGLGPTWRDIATRYKGQKDAVDRLASNVRKGSKGVWGKAPMTPTPATKISDADLRTLVGWVLKQS